jgi:hypothetical protein
MQNERRAKSNDHLTGGSEREKTQKQSGREGNRAGFYRVSEPPEHQQTDYETPRGKEPTEWPNVSPSFPTPPSNKRAPDGEGRPRNHPDSKTRLEDWYEWGHGAQLLATSR